MRTAAIVLAVLVSVLLLRGTQASAQTPTGATTTPTQYVPPECDHDHRLPDEDAIAREVLSETSDSPIFDQGEWDSTRAEVGNALRLVREELPAARNIHAPFDEPYDVWFEFNNSYSQALLQSSPDGFLWTTSTGR